MWGKVPETVKCPRNDCEHYDCKPDEAPCSQCSCNRESSSFGRTFNYKHKEEDTHEDRTRTEVGMAEPQQTSPPASDRAESGTSGAPKQS